MLLPLTRQVDLSHIHLFIELFWKFRAFESLGLFVREPLFQVNSGPGEPGR
jgi:hypothetical protein